MSDPVEGAVQELPTCKECGCRTGGGEFCYEHAPYTVIPRKDGSFRSDRNGLHGIFLSPPPNIQSELNNLQATITALRVEQAQLLTHASEWEGLALERWQEIEELKKDLARMASTK
jgi:hypothetical protein